MPFIPIGSNAPRLMTGVAKTVVLDPKPVEGLRLGQGGPVNDSERCRRARSSVRVAQRTESIDLAQGVPPVLLTFENTSLARRHS